MINTSKSIDTSQFLDQHMSQYIEYIESNQHFSFAIERRRHCFYYSNSFMIEENNDCIIYSVVNSMQTNKV